ncbi:glycoside hydrolase family 9 protein [Lutimonas zeaxanthinifaciens]|uniref:glycoside hydrolase family 9 protein n=1 Tax=Lutimonas zeaxanthinifaciens TaxID=3060215 RepID=UPI00265D1E36|nr:glycoside hydrolase family 9 protein [Lutimonas sp. YSD2104]WKK66437.1 glycoside hydrolase family 9 protein [Lutimonas sp. YSD2104]
MKKLIALSTIILLFTYGCDSKKGSAKISDQIRINQIGFYPSSVKQFAIVDTEANSFKVVDGYNNKVYAGELVDQGTWEASGEKVMLGDFSAFTAPGAYYIVVNDSIASYPFKIKKGVYYDALKAAIKSYYFQRASMPIEEEYGGIYQRAEGHMDDKCLYHPSSGRSEGTLNATGGWYDAGDYGKYIVNASLSVGQMLLILEQYPEMMTNVGLNIPETGNGITDLWDELRYELDWIQTMQDDDGGVYFKLTAKGFSGFVMPEDYDLDRYIIGKGTASTLDFAAVLAQASRLYKDIDEKWAAKALEASKKAFKWAEKNDNTAFTNPEDVSTGEYGDDEFSDDFFWAATELYLATDEDQYKTAMLKYQPAYEHKLADSWKNFVRNVGFHSLLENRDKLDQELADQLVQGHTDLADDILQNIEEHPYRIGLNSFEWGSNSDILNQAVILCVAHRLSGEEKYLLGAEQITDYIFGKNATGYSFLTGFGSKKVMFPHHRPSGADSIADPVPGFIIGGPNDDRQDAHDVKYTSEFPAKAYMDVEPSFASNEVCINWNAPAVYVLGYLEEVRE